MSKRALLVCAIVLSLPTVPSAAAYSDIQAAVAGFTDNHVTISVHNPDASPETARVQLSVSFSDGTQQTLTSSNVTVDGGATVTITLTGAHAIVGIGDDPEPFYPAM